MPQSKPLTVEPGSGGPPRVDPAATSDSPSPLETLRLTRFTGASIAAVPFLLSYVIWILLTDETALRPLPAQNGTPLLLMSLGAIAAIAAPRVAESVGRSAAARWAESGLRGGQAVPPTRTQAVLQMLMRTDAKQPVTLWSSFMQASLIGCTLPEIAVLTGFVATILTESYYFMASGVVLFFMCWWRSIPTRDKWDEWAMAAGLSIPWQREKADFTKA